MRVRNLARAVMIGTAAVSLASSPSSAQLVTFSTSGTFSQGSCGPSLCVFGGYVLTFLGESNVQWQQPSDVTLGDFAAVCFSAPCFGGNLITGSTFMLTINQSGPTSGSGSISGLLGWDSSTNTLSWNPNTSSVTIGGTTYSLQEDNIGCASQSPCIDLNTPHVNGIPLFTDIKDPVTATPEPATVALMATGLVGLIPVARRRRKNT
jgi:PEP-CTERM motif